MKICILDGSQTNDEMGERIQKPLLKEHHVQHFVIRNLKIAPCMGNFLCWTKTPGICKNQDDNSLIAEAVAQSKLLILLTPVTFGGYSSLLKQGIDHLIQIISPFFAKVEGETHHKKRYKNYPNLAVIGWHEEQDEQTELIFKHLVERNSLNLYADKTYCELFYPETKDSQIQQRITSILEGTSPQLQHHALPLQEGTEVVPSEGNTQTGTESAFEKQPELEKGIPEKVNIQTETRTRIQKALFLVGSPRKEQSSSLSLGSYLCSHPEQHLIEAETLFLYAKDTREHGEKVFAKIDKADLVILAFPLYVDSLPSPVIAFLEQLVLYRDRGKTRTPDTKSNTSNPIHFVALANCGYPEAIHNDTALANAQQFAKRAGFLWMGGLGVGGGNGFGGKSLEEGKQATVPIRMALDLAAEALAKGEPIPQASIDMATKEPYPSALFRFGALFFWKAAAAKHGAKRKIQDRPYRTD